MSEKKRAIGIREIDSTDLVAVVDLLEEGFPSRSRAYWEAGLDNLSRRSNIGDLPRYGLLMTAGDSVVGVLIAIWSVIHGNIRCNPSSWYVRPAYRSHSSFMLVRALSRRDVTYLNLSPAPATQPIVKAAGFRAYTGGSYVIDCRQSLRRTAARVILEGRMSTSVDDAEESGVLNQHLAYGCSGLLIQDADGKHPALYRTRRYKHVIPIAHFINGDPDRLVRAAPAIARHLLKRGVPLAIVDAPGDVDHSQPLPWGIRLDALRGIRYVRGENVMRPGDLLDCEMAVFGP